MAGTSTPLDQLATDEALAMRLQRQIAEELDTTPLMGSQRGQTAGMPQAGRRRPAPGRAAQDVRSNLVREFTSSWSAVAMLAFLYVPQVIAGNIVLCLYWTNPDVCDRVHQLKWKIWAIVAMARMMFHLMTVTLIVALTPIADPASRVMRYLNTAKNFVDGVGLLWFLLGNMWLFGDDGSSGTCHHPTQSPIYVLSLSMLIINYLHICLPCVVAILLIPILCFCLPCLLNVLRYLRVADEAGATAQAIEKLPLQPFGAIQAETAEVDTTCPICLGTFEKDMEVRVLPCKHFFHPQCVDEWLRLNSTCPSCRLDITSPPGEQGRRSDSGADRDGIELAPTASQSRGTVALLPPSPQTPDERSADADADMDQRLDIV
uniref:RING-type domain-containing protein n=1 Tax=Rhizochromulina marina TaxID=1034831 RepID=A0A7S2SC38_9STRA|mmetsp:Transcript_28017/g.82017  ORF Transcript_28017/g.82017 Transcript_28017/m.82017 type:complete len:375 (+) Transcript_28017:224-1348(+)